MRPDLRIEARFKNALLYNAIVEVCGTSALALQKQSGGHGVVPYIRAASLLTGVSASSISALLTLRLTPATKRGFRKCTQDLADGLGKEASVLFPESLYQLRLPAVVVKEVWSEQVLSIQEARSQRLLPSAELNETMRPALGDVVDDVLRKLKPREEQIIRGRFGMDGEEQTLSALSQRFGVGQERIRQIEAKALRKLRNPIRAQALEEFR